MFETRILADLLSIMITYLILTGLIVFLLKTLLTTDLPKIHNVYSQKGKWFHLKYWAFYVLFHLRKRQNAQQKETQGQDAGYGKRSRSSISDMEHAQALPQEHSKVDL